MRRLKVARHSFALLDNDDYKKVKKYNWFITRGCNTSYVFRNIRVDLPGGFSMWTTQQPHRFIMNPPKGMEVDHRDWNGLNNQKSNLRVVTPLENKRHRKKNKKDLLDRP